MLSNSNSITRADLEIAMLFPQSPKRKNNRQVLPHLVCVWNIFTSQTFLYFLHEVRLHIYSNFSKRTSKYFNLLSITIFKSLYCKIILNTKSIAYILCYRYLYNHIKNVSWVDTALNGYLPMLPLHFISSSVWIHVCMWLHMPMDSWRQTCT